MHMTNIIDALKWRYATKKFDTEKKLTVEQLAILKEALRLAPSSFGIQPWHFVVVENTDLRAQLRTVGYDQPQFTDASHLVVLATETKVDTVLIEKYLQSIATTKNIPLEHLTGFRGMLEGVIEAKGEAGAREWAARQVYIALGVLLTVAATLGIDAAPMEGFDPKAVDNILGLEERGLQSQVIVALGFRLAEDESALGPKVRYSEATVFTTKA